MFRVFKAGTIHGVIVKKLTKFTDERGWLAELFRKDELEGEYMPAMSYISMTQPGVARGPHEHADQADLFAFIGPSNFKVYLWDTRKDSPTRNVKQVFVAGEDSPRSVVIPKGVVHAYKNVGGTLGMVLNFPNRLFAGEGKKFPVDETRHEQDPKTMYQLD
ncbi:MAG: dTDP-4-dehydrorhamnose 3,5-epimerase family protein [Bacteroidota bacterium]|nr:dTDP-4-dehydrorhamnose 3,5-epimerase family protein [Bacteroidota bacterium]